MSKSCEEVEKCLCVSQGGVKPYERLRVVCEAVPCQSLSTHYLSSQRAGSQVSCVKNRMDFRELTAIEVYWFTIMEDQSMVNWYIVMSYYCPFLLYSQISQSERCL